MLYKFLMITGNCKHGQHAQGIVIHAASMYIRCLLHARPVLGAEDSRHLKLDPSPGNWEQRQERQRRDLAKALTGSCERLWASSKGPLWLCTDHLNLNLTLTS